MAATEQDLAESMTPSRITVLGLGNVLRTDDGAGVAVLRALAGTVSDDVDLADGGTLSFTLLDTITACDGLVVVDAAQLDAPPGTVRVFEGVEMDRFVARAGSLTVHEVSIAELFDMARLSSGLPPWRALVALQPGDTGWGDGPGSALGAAVPTAAAEVHRLIEAWQR